MSSHFEASLRRKGRRGIGSDPPWLDKIITTLNGPNLPDSTGGGRSQGRRLSLSWMYRIWKTCWRWMPGKQHGVVLEPSKRSSGSQVDGRNRTGGVEKLSLPGVRDLNRLPHIRLENGAETLWWRQAPTRAWAKDVRRELWLGRRGCCLMSPEYETCARLELLWKWEKLLLAVWTHLY